MTRPIFYTHIMKTGGSSLTTAIKRATGGRPMYPADTTAQITAAKSIPDNLLGESPERRAEYGLISVHHPAWVAFRAVDDAARATVLRDPVPRTISHLRQIASGIHPAESVESAWRDPEVRARLTDYMCQLMSDPGEPTQTAAEIDTDDPEVRATLAKSLADGWATAIWHPRRVDEVALTAAIATLDRYDVVGHTDDLDGFVVRLAAAAETPIERPGHLNRARTESSVPDWLIDEIRDATAFDRRLYAHALELAT